MTKMTVSALPLLSSHRTYVQCACILLSMSCVITYTTTIIEQQQFAMEPQDQVAVVGARVILPCRVLNKKGILQWTKDDFGLGTRRKLSAFERYSMVGSDEEGDFSLQIYPVALDDDAQYQCQVGPGIHGKQHFFLPNIHFTKFIFFCVRCEMFSRIWQT